MPNTSAFLKRRDRPAGILAGINHNGQPPKETFLYSVWEAAVLNNSGFFYYKASSHFSKQRETLFFRILLRVCLFFPPLLCFHPQQDLYGPSFSTGAVPVIILIRMQLTQLQMRWHSANAAWAKFTLPFLLGQFTILGIINLRKPQHSHHLSGEKPTALACSPSPSGLATLDLIEQLLPCHSPDCTASNLTQKLLCSIKGTKASTCWRGHYSK